jgi:hypothetical protein
MGQYYKPVFLSENNKPKNYVYSHDFGSGLKLMEHSWMKNPLVRFVEKQLVDNPQKLVWAGDYADNENPETITEREIKLIADEKSEYWNSAKLKKEGVNLYSLCECVAKLTHDEDMGENKWEHNFSEKTIAPLNLKYLINYDKQEYVDKSKVPADKDGWRIHPLPLLTCEGNDRGGGDFYVDEEKEQGNVDLIGSWARNKIGVAFKKNEIPKGFKEIKFDLIERI